MYTTAQVLQEVNRAVRSTAENNQAQTEYVDKAEKIVEKTVTILEKVSGQTNELESYSEMHVCVRRINYCLVEVIFVTRPTIDGMIIIEQG